MGRLPISSSSNSMCLPSWVHIALLCRSTVFKLPDEVTLISSWKMVKTWRVQLPRCEPQLFPLLCHHGQVTETFLAPYLLICKMGIAIVPTTWDGSQGFSRTVPGGNSLCAVGLQAIVVMDVCGDWSYLWLCLKKSISPMTQIAYPFLFSYSAVFFLCLKHPWPYKVLYTNQYPFMCLYHPYDMWCPYEPGE